uniref:homing endonuclease n=1 Tax=Leptographium wingfieldii TaxID=155675 RepID=UPI0023F0C85E
QKTIKQKNINLEFEQVFTNLQDELSILKEVKEGLSYLSGIYAFLHNDTQKAYIGSSVNLAVRISDHIKGKHSYVYLQRAFVF